MALLAFNASSASASSWMTLAARKMGFRMRVQSGVNQIPFIVSTGSGGVALNERFRPSRQPAGDARVPPRGARAWTGHQNNNPDQHVPMPFTRGYAPRTDRLGARGWSYLPAVVSPIG